MSTSTGQGQRYEAIPTRSSTLPLPLFLSSSPTPMSIATMTDVFNPPADATGRKSSVTAAVFNLTNSLLGGGTLSIPYAFAKCGVIGGASLVLLSMFLCLFSLQVICRLSQKLGCSTYSEVMEKTLGKGAKQAATYCLVLMLILIIIAYLILLRDVSSELLEYFTPDHFVVTPMTKNVLLTSLTVVAFPLMTADSLHALRYTSYCSATCMLLLLGCLCQKAFVHSSQPSGRDLLYFPTSTADLLTALPITFIGFFGHFNINGIFCDLAKPTDITRVIYTTVLTSAFVFVLFGTAGYVFARADTADNILKNFSPKDPVLMAARVGLTITLMTQLPIVVIPCRKAVYPLLWPETNRVEATTRRRAQSYDGVMGGHLSSPFQPQLLRDRSQSHGAGEVERSPVLVEVEQGMGVSLDASSVRLGLTLVIISLTLIVSQSLPGVAVVWTVAGSTLTIVICYLLPALAYLSVWRGLGAHREVDWEVLGCGGLVVVGALFMLLCTPQALQNAFSSK